MNHSLQATLVATDLDHPTAPAMLQDAPQPQPGPALPLPTRQRWQPLRLGLVELFHYDSEEFWFRDGHLLLRGNNGTGKSKVLSLTLPFLFDARLLPSRIEPDADAGKRMAWNLLMGSYDRRTGYAWIEFGRLADDGTPLYLTLGAGLAANASRPQVDSWFFVLEAAPGDTTSSARIGQDLWLTNPQRSVLGKERLREALDGRGQVFDNAAAYRRAVDERLFHLGPRRYDALMDTLIQLRAPQLSKKPDERALSNALTEALPPLAAELLGDVAEALGQLEEDRRQLDDFQALARATDRFEQRYRLYAGAQSRRQARVLRQAQTAVDTASRARADCQAHLLASTLHEAQARAALDSAELALAHQRSRIDTLLADPLMQDANRLDSASRDAAARAAAVVAAQTAWHDAQRRLARSSDETQHCAMRASVARQDLASARQDSLAAADSAGLGAGLAALPLLSLPADDLLLLDEASVNSAPAALRRLLAERRDQLSLLRQRHAAQAQADALRQQHHQARDERLASADHAASLRAQADSAVQQQGQALLDAWLLHAAGLQQLVLDTGTDTDTDTNTNTSTGSLFSALAGWANTLDGDNPAQLALQQAQQQANLRLANRSAALQAQQQQVDEAQQALLDEQSRLAAGIDAQPPVPITRDPEARTGRAGAPLWQLLDFQPQVDSSQRAGLEAALQAAGLLDAWVAPDGGLQADDGQPLLGDTQQPNALQHNTVLHDTHLQARAARADGLQHWLRADIPNATGSHPPAVPAALVQRLLASIACGPHDPADTENWVSPDGRFRLGSLAGAWSKPVAQHIGFAARAADRAQRLAAITSQLAVLQAQAQVLADQASALAAATDRAALEWRSAPTDQPLRQAHLVASAAARDAQITRAQLAQADAQLAIADAVAQAARSALLQDAADLRLPSSLAALPAVEAALAQSDDAQSRLVLAGRTLRQAVPDWQRQQARQAELQGDLAQREEQLGASRIEAEEAQARLQVLQQAIGALVGALQQQLAQARQAVAADEARLKAASQASRSAGEARAVATSEASSAEAQLQQCGQARAEAVSRLQQFVATGLLSAALPLLELPAGTEPWTIDPALALARRAEQLLSAVPDDDEAWARVQRRITEELTELQRTLGALGHQAPAETSDFGLIVHIVYQNKPERPDRLAARLADEISQRSALLSANERAVLENHLQAEIAAEVQRLLQAAERQVAAINQELHKRPTSTGVRFRLLWLPLSEDDGAPVGLETARKRLLNTSADLWSAEDRQVVGAMLQQRISAERQQAEQGLGKDGGGSLLDQLARALDYRHWHRFRVERWQDGQWRKLSGPASSGERALGLTVPLFAAVASFYSQGGNPLAPRLMLLDEAFAGIDDAARAHCMGLIREFDLDFVITSEREWACYAELPGVAIAQLQRREGVDAVFVSRWAWDGHARQRQADPDRRLAPG